jgi:hypothetical protein
MMNERIRQLWRQVELQECDCGCNPDEFLRLKFAELIVRECASKVDNILREKKDGGGTMGDEIREHFGVEE